MKKLLLSLFSLLVITNCYATTHIVLKGEGTNKDYDVARYIAASQIENQYKELPDNPLKYSSVSRIEEKPYNGALIIYVDTIVCNYTIQGQDLTGDPGFLQRKATQWMNCKEERKGDNVKLTCVIDDNTIESFKKALMEDIPFDTEFCHNRFHNEFHIAGNIKVQDGIIFGKWKYKDYFDKLGKFHTIDYGYDTWYGDHVEKLFYFGNISDDDFYKQQGQLKKMIDID